MSRKTAMVVLNYNDWKNTTQYINCVKEFACLDQIIIVDNASTDDSIKQLTNLQSKKVHLVKNEKNGGYGYGNNRGIDYATKQLGACHILISNPDIEVEEAVIKKLIAIVEQDPTIALVGPVVEECGTLNRGWKLVSPMDEVRMNFPFRKKYRTLDQYEESHYQTRLTEVDVISGCFFLMNGATRQEYGTFDEQVFLYYEEAIMSKRIQKLGQKIVVATDCKIKHNHSVSVDSAMNKAKKFKILKQSQRYYEKQYNHASPFELLLLKVTAWITLMKIKILKK